MSAYLDSLIATRDNIVAELEALTTDTPQYSVDGQSVEPRRDMLLRQLRQINEEIGKADAGFQIFSVADTN